MNESDTWKQSDKEEADASDRNQRYGGISEAELNIKDTSVTEKQEDEATIVEQFEDSILRQELRDNKGKVNKKGGNMILNLPVSTWISAAVALVFAIILLIVLLNPGSDDSSTSISQTEVFGSPTEVLQNFVKSVASNDFEKAIALFDSAYKAENFQFSVLLDGTQTWSPTEMLAPEEYEPYKSLNEVKLLSDAANQLKVFCFSFSSIMQEMGAIEADMLDLGESDYSIEEIKETLDCKRLENLKLVRIDSVNQELQNSQSYMEQKAKESAYYGYENIMEYYALYELDGTYYMGGFTAAVYDGSWRLFSIYSTLSEMSLNGDVKEVTMEEYMEALE